MIPASVCLLHRRSEVGTRICPIDNIPNPPSSLGEYYWWNALLSDRTVQHIEREEYARNKLEGIEKASLNSIQFSLESGNEKGKISDEELTHVERSQAYLNLVLTLDKEIEHLFGMNDRFSVVSHQTNNGSVPIIDESVRLLSICIE